MKTGLRKIFAVVGLLVSGAVMGVAALIFLQKGQLNEEERKKEYVVDFSVREQKRLGIECHDLKPKLSAFLQQKISPLISARKEGEAWDSLVSQGLRNQLEDYDDFLLACVRLYNIGDAGVLNGLQDLAFTQTILNDYSIIATLLKHAEKKSEVCNQVCLDSRFNTLKEAHERLKNVLKSP